MNEIKSRETQEINWSQNIMPCYQINLRHSLIWSWKELQVAICSFMGHGKFQMDSGSCSALTRKLLFEMMLSPLPLRTFLSRKRSVPKRYLFCIWICILLAFSSLANSWEFPQFYSWHHYKFAVFFMKWYELTIKILNLLYFRTLLKLFDGWDFCVLKLII